MDFNGGGGNIIFHPDIVKASAHEFAEKTAGHTGEMLFFDARERLLAALKPGDYGYLEARFFMLRPGLKPEGKIEFRPGKGCGDGADGKILFDGLGAVEFGDTRLGQWFKEHVSIVDCFYPQSRPSGIDGFDGQDVKLAFGKFPLIRNDSPVVICSATGDVLAVFRPGEPGHGNLAVMIESPKGIRVQSFNQIQPTCGSHGVDGGIDGRDGQILLASGDGTFEAATSKEQIAEWLEKNATITRTQEAIEYGSPT